MEIFKRHLAEAKRDPTSLNYFRVQLRRDRSSEVKHVKYLTKENESLLAKADK